jgi:hypothetical protein
MPRTPSLRRVAGVALAISALIVAGRLVVWCRDHLNGIEIRVHNVDTHVVRGVSVEVRGHSYDLGDLMPGMTRTVKVEVSGGESGLAIGQRTAAGRRTDTVHAYIEQGYSGWQLVDVTQAEAHTVEEHFHMY